MATYRDSIVVKHREFIQDVTGQTNFTATSFPINPGRDTLFTWLPDLANRYERYQFDSLRFIYEPRCSTATAGTVILAVDYDALDSAPVSKQDVYAYHHSSQSSAWDESCMMVEPEILRSRGPLYTRPGAAPAGSDLKSYDLGNLWLCVSGFSGAVVCGELFVEYTVSLRIPQIQSNVQSGSINGTAGLAAGSLFGSAQTVAGLLDLTITSASTITFNQNFSGDLVIEVLGTGLVPSAYANTGTCTATVGGDLLGSLVNAAASAAAVYVKVKALRGQTFIPAITASTVSSDLFLFYPTVQ
jgi:hypothetical protein